MDQIQVDVHVSGARDLEQAVRVGIAALDAGAREIAAERKTHAAAPDRPL